MGCLVLDIILDKTKPKTVNLFLEIKAAKMLFLVIILSLTNSKYWSLTIASLLKTFSSASLLYIIFVFIVSRSPLPTRKGIPIYIRIITKDLTSFANSFWVLVFSSWSLIDVLDLNFWEQFSNYWISLDISGPYSSISIMLAYFMEISPCVMDHMNWIIISSRFSVVIQNLNVA